MSRFASVPVTMSRATPLLRQSPTAGTEVSLGIAVIIEIADGPVVPEESVETTQVDVVPYVLGSQRDAAEASIGSAGYQTSISYGYYGTSRPGKVMSQYPEAGTPAVAGTVVYISVSLSEQPLASVTVPDVNGLSRSAAGSRLRDVGLEPFVLERPPPAPQTVASDQWPRPGTIVDSGTRVYFVFGIND